MRIKLKQAQGFALMTLVRDEYTVSGYTDPEFSRHATEKLGFEVNANHVQGARRAFDILGNGRPKAAPTGVAAFEALRMQVAALELSQAQISNRLHDLIDELKEAKAITGRVLTNLAKGAAR